MGKENGSSVKFVIVGGGIAGLAAAHKLIKSGERDIVILEAKGRLGGRIHTIREGEGPLELGAQWIHGEEGNALCDLARNNGYLFQFKDGETRKKFWLDFKDNGTKFDGDTCFCTSDGSRVPMDLIRRIVNKINDILYEAEKYFREEKRDNFRKLLLGEVQNHLMLCQENYLQPGDKIFDEAAECDQTKDGMDCMLEKEDISVAAFIERHLADCLSSAEDEEAKELMLGLLDWRLCVEKTENSCSSLDEIPLCNWGEYYLCPGEEGVELGQHGYQPIVDFFVKDIPSSCVRLDSVVKKIVWTSVGEADDEFVNYADENSEAGAGNVGSANHASTRPCGGRRRQSRSRNSSSADKSGKIEVRLDSGETLLADYVMVTLPLGVLKHHCLQKKEEQLFIPKLPRRKLEAIEKLAYGTVDKIYLEFETPFWGQGNELGFQIIWKRGETIELDCLQKWGRCYEDTKWYRAIQGFNALLQHPNFLCGWIAGADAIEMEKEDERFVADVCRELLVKFSGLTSEDVGVPKKIVRTCWYQDPYSRGSYSYRCFGSSVESSIDLAQPLPSVENPRLLFAGEATHSIFYSTVHGAMMTGFNQACTVLKHSQSQSQKLPN